MTDSTPDLEERASRRRFARKRTAISTVFLLLGLGLPWIASLAPSLVENEYMRRIFPLFASLTGLVSGLFRVSLGQLAVGFFLVVILLALGRGLFGMIRRRSMQGALASVHRWMALSALLVWSYQLLYGLESARPPLNDRLGLPPTQADAHRLLRLTRHLAEEVNRSYQEARDSGELRGDSISAFVPDRDEFARDLKKAYGAIQPAIAHLPFSQPKFPAVGGWLMTRAGISGIYFAYTGEAHVNREMPDAAIPSVMAHEMAHQRGDSREDEANFLAYLACARCAHPAIRYSGSLGAFGLVSNALWMADRDSFAALGRGLLTGGPRADRAAIRAFWQRHEGRATMLADRINDFYLKANTQKAGVQSYGRAVDLLLAWEAARADSVRPNDSQKPNDPAPHGHELR